MASTAVNLGKKLAVAPAQPPTPAPTATPGSELALALWAKPERVQKRVDSLAAHIRRVVQAAAPPSPEQMEALRALLPPGPAKPSSRPSRSKAGRTA